VSSRIDIGLLRTRVPFLALLVVVASVLVHCSGGGSDESSADVTLVIVNSERLEPPFTVTVDGTTLIVNGLAGPSLMPAPAQQEQYGLPHPVSQFD
jgi:hypothetical protein